jgi:hypothetical protein
METANYFSLSQSFIHQVLDSHKILHSLLPEFKVVICRRTKPLRGGNEWSAFSVQYRAFLEF